MTNDKPDEPVPTGPEPGINSPAATGDKDTATSAAIPATTEERAESGIVPDQPHTPVDNVIYDDRPVGMYELAAQMGIEIPASKDELLKKAVGCLGTVFNNILNPKREKSVLWAMTKSIASDLENILSCDANIVTELQRPRKDRDRLIWHSIYTAIMAMQLARDVRDLPCTIQDIGAGALLHDIGLLGLKDLSEKIFCENMPAYQDHVIKGLQMARKMATPACVMTIIAQHHEQLDGQGFPNRISGDEMLVSSQIVAISNLFEHALIALNGEASAPQADTLIDIPRLFKVYRKAFDNDLLKKMIRTIGFYPVGTVVELNNRSVCRVIRQNMDVPLRPVVTVIVDGSGNHPDREKIIDLQQVALLSITRSVMHNKR